MIEFSHPFRSVHPENPEWTLKQLKPWLELRVNIPFIGSNIEKWCESTFVSKTSEAVKIELAILDRLSGQSEEGEEEEEDCSDPGQTANAGESCVESNGQSMSFYPTEV